MADLMAVKRAVWMALRSVANLAVERADCLAGQLDVRMAE
jgi:hypothetical protein